MEEASIAASVASVVLAFLAVGLSAYFYTQGKSTERDVAVSLAKIESQTETLQKLTGRWMDRLTRYATQLHPAEQALIVMATNAVPKMPTPAETKAPSDKDPSSELVKDLVSSYIVICYFTAVANLAQQPFVANGGEAAHQTVGYLNASYRTFHDYDDILSKVDKDDKDLITSNPLNYLYDEVQKLWKPLVKDAETVRKASEDGQ